MRDGRGINRITGAVISIGLRVIIYSFLIVALIEGVRFCYNFGHNIFYVQAVDPSPGRDVRVVIKSGTDEKDAAEMLEDLGLIDNKTSFIVQAKFFEYDIEPGTYELNTSMTSREMLELFNSGPESQEESGS